MFLVFTHTPPPIPPPSLQTRVGGGILSLHPFPLPLLPSLHPPPSDFLYFKINNIYNILILILRKQGTVIPMGITVVFSKPTDTRGCHCTLIRRVRCSRVRVWVWENIPAGYPCHTLAVLNLCPTQVTTEKCRDFMIQMMNCCKALGK